MAKQLELPSTEGDFDLVLGSAKAAMKDAGASSADLWKVDPRKLQVIEGFNGRIRTPDYLEHLAHIKASIAANGFYPDKPLAGYVAQVDGENVIYVTEGHTRYTAVMELLNEGVEIAAVPVVIKPKGTTIEDLTVALVTSNDGRPFTTYETALMVKRLVGFGMDEGEIAKRLNFKTGKPYVESLLLLAGAPKSIREMLIRDEITATTAIQELKKNATQAPARLEKAVEKAKAMGKSKATPKHLDKTETPVAKKADKGATPKPKQMDIEDKAVAPKSLDVLAVIQDSVASGIEVGKPVSEDQLIKFAATLLARFGVEVYSEESDDDDL